MVGKVNLQLSVDQLRAKNEEKAHEIKRLRRHVAIHEREIERLKSGESTANETQLRQLNYEKAQEIKKLTRKIGRLEKEISSLESSFGEAYRLKKEDTNVPKWVRTVPKKGSKHLVHPVLMLSDLHLDEVVDSRNMGGFNAYDRDIAVARFERTINVCEEYLTTYVGDVGIEGMTVYLGGDIVSGDIHDELKETNEHPTPETVRFWVPQVAAGIRHLASVFGRVHVPCIEGNHDRTGKQKKTKRRPEEAWTWIFYHWLADLLRDDENITFSISRSTKELYTIYDTTFLLAHGDQARGGTGIGGIYVPIHRWAAKEAEVYASIGKTFDYALIGHWHQVHFGHRVIINGSLKGYDEFARSFAFPAEKPQQVLFLVSPEHGITMRTTIFCDGQ